MQSLAEHLGTLMPAQEGERLRLEDIADSEAFARAVLSSREFRSYIVDGLVLGSLPPAVILRVMDMGGWTKPPERIEHTGRDGRPIETVKIIRVIVDPHVGGEEVVQGSVH